MQYVIMDKGYVIWGPRDWNFRSVQNCILDDCEVTFEAPLMAPVGPIVVNSDIKILPCRMDYPSYNSKIEQLAGPYWLVENGVAVGSYTIVPQNIDFVKANLKQKVAANRYREETKDIHLNIQNTDIIVEGDRTNKITIISMTSLMDDVTPYNFKFPKSGNWLPMMKSDMYVLIGAFVTQTQGAFDWEAAKGVEIDACTTLEDLDVLDIGDPIVEHIGMP